jgi:hypothetical protein
MPKSSSHRAQHHFPNEARTRAILGEFDVALLEPNEQYRHWGIRFVMNIKGVEHICKTESDVWPHFKSYMLWWFRNAAHYDQVTHHYRHGTDVERQAIRDWIVRGARMNEMPGKMNVSEDEEWKRLDPWDERWLAKIRTGKGHPLFLSSRSLEVLLPDAIQAIDAEREKKALDGRLPMSAELAQQGRRL